MAASLLTSEAIKALEHTLPAWRVVDGALERQWSFPDFVRAWGFMTQVALIAQAMDHPVSYTHLTLPTKRIV